MCVIIYSEKQLDYEDLQKAFDFNSDGAGFSVVTNSGTIYKKGFMTFSAFYQAFKKYNVAGLHKVVHFRITSKGKTNKEQTHPFKAGEPKSLSCGKVKRNLFFMNGTIIGQDLRPNLNDTASFVEDLKLFVGDVVFNQDMVDSLEDMTDSLWSVVSDGKVFVSKSFINVDGVYYSNLYHQTYSKYYFSCKTAKPKANADIKKYIGKGLYNKIKSDAGLLEDLQEYIDYNCSYKECTYCINQKDCIKEATTKEELNDALNYYFYMEYYSN